MTREEKWMYNYNLAKRYYEEKGNLRVARTYVTPEGFKLGAWLHVQRCAKRGTGAWRITKKQIALLNKIDMRWGEEKPIKGNASTYVSPKKQNEIFMQSARKFYKENGNLDFPKGTKERVWLDSLRWSAANRKDKSIPPQGSFDIRGRLSLKNINELTKMGMNWNSSTYELATKRVEAIRKYKEKYGTANVPINYVDEEGNNIGMWLARQRQNNRGTANGNLPQTVIDDLDALAVSWNPRIEKRIETIERWYAEFGNLDFPVERRDRMKEWLDEKRTQELEGNGDQLLKDILEELGIPWP